MLQPNDRRHLFESLRPPSDYSLDCAIGTTFTLDLLALLTAPLAFTSFEWADEDGHLTRTPHALLATMQQYADRISIFCQTGKIAIPKTYSLLYSYLEGSVIEVNAPQPGGIFHPKIWVLRFTAPNQPVLYRFLCVSRNLTFDRSWDTILLLDGQLIEGGKTVAANRPLSDFITALPQLAHNPPITQRVQANVDRIGAELQRVQFERPPEFEQVAFHSLGLPGKVKDPFDGQIDRLLVMSPFISNQRLNQLGQRGKRNILISRPEELDQIPSATLATFAQLYQISPAANPDDADQTTDTSTQVPLVGLHAKLYIADVGQNARVWTGSANATDAAFNRNVEFLVELVGSKQRFGIDALLKLRFPEVSFRNLLEPFTPLPEPISIDDALGTLVNLAESRLLKFHLTAHVLPIEEPDQYCLQLRFAGDERMEFPPDILVRCYPITRHDLATTLNFQTTSTNQWYEPRGKPRSVFRPKGRGINPQGIEFKPLTCQALTSFFAFEIWTSDDKQKLSSFMLNVPLEGIPANRRQQVLRSLLQDKNQVLKLLLFLLADGKADARELLMAMGGSTTSVDVGLNGSSNGSRSNPSLFPLFEAMVRALDRNPMKLDHIARLVNDLRQLPPEEQLLPDNFEDIWQPIYAARQRLNP